MAAVSRPAWAKLNLYLHVTGRRPDGYHLLDSVFAYVALYDEVSARAGGGPSLTVDGPFAPAAPVEDNIVTRAQAAYVAHRSLGGDAAIHLTKNIPVAAGLGGGSADAAATLRVLGQLYDAPLTPDEAHQIALALGADVPAAWASRPARVRGIGERIEHLAGLPEFHVALVNPGIALSTPDVFRAYAASAVPFSMAAPELSMDQETFFTTLSELRNDLQPAAVSLAPEIESVLERLAATPGCRLARLSGSGATCFGLYPSATLAEAAAVTLAVDHGWWAWSGGMAP